MAATLSLKVCALVALLSVLVTYGAQAHLGYHDASDSEGGYNNPSESEAGYSGSGGGYNNAPESKGGCYNTSDSRGGYNNASKSEGGYNDASSSRGGYNNASGSKEGYNNVSKSKGSYNNASKSKGSYNNASGSRGSYNNSSSYEGGLSYSNGSWTSGKATWYGRPNGAGPDNNGGGCGYSDTNKYPFNSMTSCGNQPIFRDGKGCGSCYQIRCTSSNNRACSGTPQTVIITDVNYDTSLGPYHFDLSGTAFGAMAKPGRNQDLRNAGVVDIQFRRVPCDYKDLKVTFHVQRGCNPFYFAVLVKYAGSDGAVEKVHLREANSGAWKPLYVEWGAVWRLDPGHPLQAPLSLRVITDSGKVLEAYDVIPQGWKGDTDYRANTQFY
ncbi:hypothetical protein ACP70R_020891 [Stipagrostis hirtigluma subsp. patula]